MIGHWTQLLETCVLWAGSSDSPVNRCVEFAWTACWVAIPM